MYRNYIKRFLDFTIVFCVLFVIWPFLFIITILLLLLNDGAGAFFTQERPGYKGKIFKIIKFKTMNEKKDENGVLLPDVQRITKFGAIVRKLSIDELPQLFNVLKGEMSLIGPRPERPYFVEQFKETIPRYMIKHQVRPGLTGWAQVNGLRGDTSIKKRIEYDLYYIENWTLGLDIKILFLTFFKGFINKNAY